jgi:hypothetical protein
MIRRRDPGNFGAFVLGVMQNVKMPEGGFWVLIPLLIDQITGPVVISACLFFAVLANFIFRGAILGFVSRLMMNCPLMAVGFVVNSVRELYAHLTA